MANQQIIKSSKNSYQKFTFSHPLLQNFALTAPIVQYIIQSKRFPKSWKKLMQTCKFFYCKFPVIAIMDLRILLRCEADNEIIDPLSIVPKIWVFRKLQIYMENMLSEVLLKIAHRDYVQVDIQKQSLSWAEYEMLTSGGKIQVFSSSDCTIASADGTLASVDEILQKLPKIKKFNMGCSQKEYLFKPQTIKNLVDLLVRFDLLETFQLTQLPVNFDSEALKQFLSKNKTFYCWCNGSTLYVIIKK